MSDLSIAYDIRDVKPEDHSFIYSSFLRGVYHGDSWFSRIPKAEFIRHYRVVVDSILASPKFVVKVASLKEDPDVILGYSILSSDYQAISWVFVKWTWRKQGIARNLVPKHATVAMHLTAVGDSLMKSKFSNMVFNPFYNL